jgi:hypothetical protein
MNEILVQSLIGITNHRPELVHFEVANLPGGVAILEAPEGPDAFLHIDNRSGGIQLNQKPNEQ